MSNEIRTLIEQWATAVHQGDLSGVLAAHTDDVVMFDVPANARGIAAYRDTWPAFFEWQANGAVFEIESLDITAGADVAFAHALVRCGMPAEVEDQRLRLTFGLRRISGRWQIAHEHHSFAVSGDGSEEIRSLHSAWFEATARKDIDGIMSHIADDVVSYEHEAPLAYIGADAVREVCQSGLDRSSGTVTWTVPNLTVHTRDDLAVAWGLNHMTADLPDGTTEESHSRGTRVFHRRNGRWQLIHQHVSYPYQTD